MVPSASTTDTQSAANASNSPTAARKPSLRTFALLAYMMRVPVLALLIIGVGLPLGFGSSMLHGLADVTINEVFRIAGLASLLVSCAITTCFLILLYGEERLDGWQDRGDPEDRVPKWAVALLYAGGAGAWVSLMYAVDHSMADSGPVFPNLQLRFLAYSLLGALAGLAIVLIFFFGALRLAKPDDDEALESFAFPAAYLLPRDSAIRKWIRAFKGGTRHLAVPGSFASHTGSLSKLFARLGPGYGSQPTPGKPSRLRSGHRFVALAVAILFTTYLAWGVLIVRQLKDATQPWPEGGAPNSVLSYVLVLIIFWTCVLGGITFFVDRYRLPALLALAGILGFVAMFGPSDHQFSTAVPQTEFSRLPLPSEMLRSAAKAQGDGAVVVVASAGGGIQSAAWSARVLCGLRAALQTRNFHQSIAAISGVSGGSVGAMFYLRCVESAPDDEKPALRAQNSSLDAVAWGLVHPDLQRVFVPWLGTFWRDEDRGWALEESFLKSVEFAPSDRRLSVAHPAWPALLLNSTSAQSGDPFVFSNSQFPAASDGIQENHRLRSFYAETGRDVPLESAARMSAAFPYVSPVARPDQGKFLPHLADGGYFDNSGVFALSEWLKRAVSDPQQTATPAPNASHAVVSAADSDPKRILILQLDAFPDSSPEPDMDRLSAEDRRKEIQREKKKWYYQLLAPVYTILKVRSESQVVRDNSAGSDLQSRLNFDGYPTEWLLVRYDPGAARQSNKNLSLPVLRNGQSACSQDPPLSWHLTRNEKTCIEDVWNSIRPAVASALDKFLSGKAFQTEDGKPKTGCDPSQDLAAGVRARVCAAEKRGSASR